MIVQTVPVENIKMMTEYLYVPWYIHPGDTGSSNS